MTSGISSAIGGIATGAALGVALKKSDFKFGEKGIKVQRTPGEFNHDTNEMYVVDEDGRDVGIALTGGEYVIAPKDAQKLKQLAGSGKGKLHKFVGSLVRRFEKT